MKTVWKEFYDKAALLGHDAEALASGRELITYLRFATLPEGSRLLSVATKEQRIERQAQFFNPPIAARQRLGQGIHDRGEAILFAGGEFFESDYQGVGNHMPARLKAISVLKKTIHAGEVWDVSVRGEQWGIDDLEELYVTVNVGELVLEPGAKIIVRGNVFSLLCQRLVCNNVLENDYHIGILPTPFSVDLKNGPHNGVHGAYGLHGRRGRDGEKANVSSSMVGYMLANEITEAAMKGGDGTNGENGLNGTDGRNGGMCKIAELAIRELRGHCTVLAQAGTGGNGGNGGDGGNGANGGDGTQGYKLITRILPAGDGGNGGNGGDGGKAGHAGHGGLASNIYINVPQQQEALVSCMALPAPGGRGGTGGRAGKGGNGGRGGTGVAKAANGQNGKEGLPGKNGHGGRERPAPWIFLNEKKSGTTIISETLHQLQPL
jgi:hypothetical protein